eukprot:1159530-Pelagomonas_calceolata.AAC.5
MGTVGEKLASEVKHGSRGLDEDEEFLDLTLKVSGAHFGKLELHRGFINAYTQHPCSSFITKSGLLAQASLPASVDGCVYEEYEMSMEDCLLDVIMIL